LIPSGKQLVDHAECCDISKTSLPPRHSGPPGGRAHGVCSEGEESSQKHWAASLPQCREQASVRQSCEKWAGEKASGEETRRTSRAAMKLRDGHSIGAPPRGCTTKASKQSGGSDTPPCRASQSSTRASRSGAATLDSTHKSSWVTLDMTHSLFYRRADCRFTLPGLTFFVGIDSTAPASGDFCGPAVFQIDGEERTRILVLLEQAEKGVHLVRNLSSGSNQELVAFELPGLLRDLSRAFVVHMQDILEPDGLAIIDNTPVALALLAVLVEVLDVLVAPESDDVPGGCQSVRDDSGREVAALISGLSEGTDDAVTTLRECVGQTGFLPVCLDCLGEGVFRTKLLGIGASEVAAELAMHAALATRLVLAWVPPLGVPHPCNVLLAVDGCARLFSTARASLSQLQGCFHGAKRSESSSPRVISNLGQVALMLDSLHMALRSDAYAHQLLTSRGGAGGKHSFVLREASGATRKACDDPVSPLLPLTIEALQHLAAYPALGGSFTSRDQAMAAAIEAAATASLHLVTVIADFLVVTPHEHADSIASALREIVQGNKVGHRFFSALRALVCRPHCKRNWLKTNGTTFHRELRRALAVQNIPGECIRTALHNLSTDAREGKRRLGKREGPERRSVGPSRAAAAEIRKKLVEMGALCEDLEAVACAIHGPGAACEEGLLELHALCARAAHGGQLVEKEHYQWRPSTKGNLNRLRGKVLETCTSGLTL